MTQAIERDWFDIQFSVGASVNPEYSVIFTVRRHLLPAESGIPQPAMLFLTGQVLTTGRSEWSFYENEEWVRFGSLHETQQLAELFRRLYHLAAELLPQWREEILGV